MVTREHTAVSDALAPFLPSAWITPSPPEPNALYPLLRHALGTPLTSVLGYLELIQEGGGALPAALRREYLSRAHANAHRCVALLNAATELARIDHGNIALIPTPISVGALLKEVADAFGALATDRQVGLGLAPVEESLRLTADRSCLLTVLSHLLRNACSYTAPGGEVLLTAGASGDRISISVKDSGIGIPEAEWGCVFSRFYRGSNARGLGAAGSGLGLAIARALVGLLGGALSFRSKVSEGSVFTVQLPVVPPALLN